MQPFSVAESDVVDDLDRKILQALQINGRAAFSLIGQAVGASEQTVARRYRRMRAAGVVRVIGLVDPTGQGQLDWMIRITCRPGAATALAAALARRDDVAWVSLTGAGNEIMAFLRSRTQDARNELLLERLPKTAQVLNLSASMVMHLFTGRYDKDWRTYADGLTDEALAALISSRATPAADAERPGGSSGSTPSEALLPEDKPLLAALAVDGRMSIPVLAEAAGWSQGRTRRRLDALIGSGSVYLDVDVALGALGLPVLAMLWLTIDPQSLDSFGRALVEENAVTFAGATTGSSNLAAAVALPGVEALYQFVNRIGTLAPGLRQLDVAPVIQRIKQAGSLVEGARLRPPEVPATTSP